MSLQAPITTTPPALWPRPWQGRSQGSWTWSHQTPKRKVSRIRWVYVHANKVVQHVLRATSCSHLHWHENVLCVCVCLRGEDILRPNHPCGKRQPYARLHFTGCIRKHHGGGLRVIEERRHRSHQKGFVLHELSFIWCSFTLVDLLTHLRRSASSWTATKCWWTSTCCHLPALIKTS